MKSFLWKTVLVVVLILGLLVYWFYYNVYSDGERKGMLIKITRKGNLFKTYEGEMWLSCRQLVNVEKFQFSIVDEKLADSLSSLQDECIKVFYHQFRHSLPWRGDSPYIIERFERSDKTAN